MLKIIPNCQSFIGKNWVDLSEYNIDKNIIHYKLKTMPIVNENNLELEKVSSNSVIIIHPGSLYLRIGRASDVTPFKYVHGLARVNLLSEMMNRRDQILPNFPYKNSDTLAAMEDSRLQASHMLQSSLQSNGDRRMQHRLNK